eukprot:Opistho-2@74615
MKALGATEPRVLAVSVTDGFDSRDNSPIGIDVDDAHHSSGAASATPASASAPGHATPSGRALDDKQWPLLIRLFLGTTVFYAARSGMTIAVVKMKSELGYGPEVMGLVLSSFFWGYITTQMIGGHLADRYSGSRLIGMAAMLWGAATFFIPDACDMMGVTAIIALRIVTGVFQGFHFPSLANILSREISAERRSFASGFAYSGSYVGTVLVGILGSLIIDSYGWRSVFRVFGALAVAWNLLMWRPYQRTMHSDDSSSSRYAAPSQWRTIIRLPGVWACIGTHFSFGMFYFVVHNWLPTYFHETLEDSLAPWVTNVLPYVLMSATSPLVGIMADRMRARGVSLTNVRKFFQIFFPPGGCVLYPSPGDNRLAFPQTRLRLSGDDGIRISCCWIDAQSTRHCADTRWSRVWHDEHGGCAVGRRGHCNDRLHTPPHTVVGPCVSVHCRVVCVWIRRILQVGHRRETHLAVITVVSTIFLSGRVSRAHGGRRLHGTTHSMPYRPLGWNFHCYEGSVMAAIHT